MKIAHAPQFNPLKNPNNQPPAPTSPPAGQPDGFDPNHEPPQPSKFRAYAVLGDSVAAGAGLGTAASLHVTGGLVGLAALFQWAASSEN
ncbi:hypothetical protein IV102_03030 [bacterium]|nr:hypothetical protein [bacterium]